LPRLSTSAVRAQFHVLEKNMGRINLKIAAVSTQVYECNTSYNYYTTFNGWVTSTPITYIRMGENV